MDYNQRTNEWSLIIQDVRPSDEGIYACAISTKQESSTYDIKLNVKSQYLSFYLLSLFVFESHWGGWMSGRFSGAR